MDDPVRVRALEGEADLAQDAGGEVGPKLSARRQHHGHVVPLQKLHDHVRAEGLIFANVENVDDVLAVDGRCGPGLAKKSSRRLSISREERREHLDRDALAELEGVITKLEVSRRRPHGRGTRAYVVVRRARARRRVLGAHTDGGRVAVVVVGDVAKLGG